MSLHMFDVCKGANAEKDLGQPLVRQDSGGALGSNQPDRFICVPGLGVTPRSTVDVAETMQVAEKLQQGVSK